MDDFSDFFRKYDQFLIDIERAIYIGMEDIRENPTKKNMMELLEDLQLKINREKLLLRIEESMYSIQSMYNVQGVDNDV